jgi:hypothetical protein
MQIVYLWDLQATAPSARRLPVSIKGFQQEILDLEPRRLVLAGREASPLQKA